MVNLLAEDNLLKVRSAAARIARNFEGHPSTVAETIRKQYSHQKKAGQLPPPQNRQAVFVDTILGYYGKRAAFIADAKQKLSEAEGKASELNLDISPENLPAVISSLQGERDRLAQLLYSPDLAFSHLLQKKIPSEQVAGYLSEASTKVIGIDSVLKILRLISELRDVIPSDL